MKTARSLNVTHYDEVQIDLSQQKRAFLVREDRELLKKFENAISMRDALERMRKLRPDHKGDVNPL